MKTSQPFWECNNLPQWFSPGFDSPVGSNTNNKTMNTAQQQAQNAKKWLDELASGNWKKGTVSLKSGDKYCCLGVACEMFGLDPMSPGTSYQALPDVLGLGSRKGEFSEPIHGSESVWNLNDVYYVTDTTFENIHRDFVNNIDKVFTQPGVAEELKKLLAQ